MRLNDTTRAYFTGWPDVVPGVRAYRDVLSSAISKRVQAPTLAAHTSPRTRRLRTSISPNIIKGGYPLNVIPSEAKATLDIRALAR